MASADGGLLPPAVVDTWDAELRRDESRGDPLLKGSTALRGVDVFRWTVGGGLGEEDDRGNMDMVSPAPAAVGLSAAGMLLLCVLLLCGAAP